MESGLELIIELKRSSGGLILNVAGSLDRLSMEEVLPTFAKISDQYRESLILNLYECEYLDEDALQRIMDLSHLLRDQGRGFTVFVRPMSFVAFRTQGLPQSNNLPNGIVLRGEERLARRRTERLAKWREEKPVPVDDSNNAAPDRADEPSPQAAEGSKKVEGRGSKEDEVRIDLTRVSSLAGTDERVIDRIWDTYTQFLTEGRFPIAADGSAETQLTIDSNTVAKALRLNPRTVRKVVEVLSKELMEVLDSDKESPS